jgi:hypothetical protein
MRGKKMQKTKLKFVFKKILGGNKMRSKRKNTLGTTFILFMFICSMFASFITVTPTVAAANGLGEITKFQNEEEYPVTPPDVVVQTVNTEKEITFWLHNDGPEGTCIDEIIITFPDTWQGGIDTSYVDVTNMGDVVITNEKDDGTYSGLEPDSNSIRIVPDYSSDGVMLCPSGTTEITIGYGAGLKSPTNPEDSEIMIMTSDENSNEPSSSYVRQPIDILPVIKVTNAEKLKIEYIQKSDFEADANADYRFTGKAWGAWGRLDELYIQSSAAATIDVYLDNGDGVFDGLDTWKIASSATLAAGVNTVSLTYDATMNIGSEVYQGYVKDGSTATYFIVITSGSPTLTNVGHKDSARYLDPSVVGTGFEGIAEGTVITVNDAPVPADGRKIKIQLVREEGGRLLDVKEQDIPIYYTTDLGTFTETSPELTDANGQSEINLLPSTTKGVANVNVCFPDTACEDEHVGINARPADYCAITKGLDVTVEAGDIVEIEATVYDEFGNVITDVPNQELVEFDLISKPDADASLDDDTVLGAISNHEEELTNLGTADTYLHTSATVGDHVVEVQADGLDCGQTTITGVLGQADAMECSFLNDSFEPIIADQIKADECFNVVVNVVDKNGNPLEKWESIVEISLNDTNKYIESTDLREEVISEDGQSVKGKLNNNDPAYANIRICGCDALGTLDVICKSDTLDDDRNTLDVINSEPSCIDVGVEDRDNECDYTMKLHTSILDTCGNKLVDQECAEGGWASSCVRLETSCGYLSTDKTCVDLKNTGQAPLVDLDISECGCGDIIINATDEPDCCPSVYEGTLPQCGDVIINKLGPATRIDMEVYPSADNQDNFWVSEKTVVDLTLKDDCDQEVTCDSEIVDMELTGEDCVDDTIQVDEPYTTDEQQECIFKDKVVHKVVIENCGNGSKEAGNKEWTDLPEKHDIVVDKIAFEYTGPVTDGVTACIYEETEETVGFQADEDLLWKCVELDTVPVVPLEDADSYGNEGAADGIHFNYAAGTPDGSGDQVICHNDHGDGPYVTIDPIDYSAAANHVSKRGLRNHLGDHYGPCNGDESITFLIELDDRISKYNGNNEYDNQRQGGAIIEPGDTKDFYIVLSKDSSGYCGTYDADYLYFQDYNSPDIISWTPSNKYDTHVRDTIEGSEEYTRRNDDYTGSDPYPNTMPATADYGFGDRILHNLMIPGNALVYIRDLVAETVNIFIDSDLPIQLIDNSLPVVEDNQALVTFLAQPATQVVARNHGDLSGDEYICDDAGFEPTYEYDRDNNCQGNPHCPQNEPIRDCRPAMACEEEGYDINLQITDGFQNPVGLETEVQLHSCLTFPHFIYLGDTLLPIDENITVDLWDVLGLHDKSSDPWDACFDMDKFRQALKDIINNYLGHDDYFATAFLESTEFTDFVNSIFEGKNVKFFDGETGIEITERDSAGHLIIRTDSDGKAKVRVESDDSSMFQIKSFDASFRLFFVPHALDADYIDVAFAPGTPAKWDIMAVPEKGVPADGEQEAKLLIRKTDACGNPVVVKDEQVKVRAISDSGRAVISRDFNFNNNYDSEVMGDMSQWTCRFLLPWFEDCSLQLLDDVIENVTVVVEDAECESGTNNGFCTGPEGADCELIDEEEVCNEAEVCSWVSEEVCQESDSTVVEFVGAPIKLTITEIKHSDLIPADGWEYAGNFDLPADACTDNQIIECSLNGEPEICFKNCIEYGNTGAWVTVEVQDKFDNRVTGYLGDGFKGDPGDVNGNSDNVFEKICIALDDPRAFIADYTFGWVNLDQRVGPGPLGRVYCGDLAYGKGAFKVAYHMLDKDGQPLDPRETEKVVVSVFDICDREMFEQYGGDWKEQRWDDLCNAQEYDENNLPDSETASRLDPDSNKIIFTSVPDRWDIEADKVVVAADGKDYAIITINTENEYMDVRTSLDATVQSSLLGSKLESEAINQDCYVDGTYDSINPTSINVQTEDCSGGRAQLKLSSTEPGIARVTVTGNGFGCKDYMDSYQYMEYFEELFGEGGMYEEDWLIWQQHCEGNEAELNIWGEYCEGQMEDFHVYKEHCTGSVSLDDISPYGVTWEEWCRTKERSYEAWNETCLGLEESIGAWYENCSGIELSYHEYFYWYYEITHGTGVVEEHDLYTPYCSEWGVIPLTPKTIEVEFKQSFQDKIVLKEGWNFFSIPKELDPSNDEWSELGLDTTCTASAMWDDSSQTWVAPIPGTTVLEPMEGYWCKISSDTTIPVKPLDATGAVYLPPTKHIYSGWNDVGLSTYVETVMEHALISIDNIYTQILDWLETLQRYASFANTGEAGGGDVPGTTGSNSMKAGQGYFIYAQDEGDLAGLS